MSGDLLGQLIEGRRSPTPAYALGQIELKGSLGVAMKLARLLGSRIAGAPAFGDLN
jgi:putative sterol carrier protein